MTGAGGAAVGVWGGTQIKRAKSDMKDRAAHYEARYSIHLQVVDEVNVAFKQLGDTQKLAQERVIFRMKAFLERHEKQVRANEHLILDGVDGANRRVLGLTKLEPDLAGWVRGVVGSTFMGIATPAVLRTGVVSLATASTGTAISGLTGIAATNATLAWLGGGALAAGGGGMALGAVMLNVAVIGPTLLVAGITVKNRGTKARTEAEKHRTDVDIEVAQLDARDQLLRTVQSRVNEIELILTQLVAEAVAALDLLESEPFDMERDAERLQKSLILVKSVRDVATAPVADEHGNLDQKTEEIAFKYRRQTEESVDGR